MLTKHLACIAGASSDLKQATSIAQHMVKDWGMSEKVGLRTIEGQRGMMASEALGPNTIEAVSETLRQSFFWTRVVNVFYLPN